MGRKHTVAETDATAYLAIRIPGWLKNDIHALCASQGVSMNNWALTVLKTAVDAAHGLPAPPPAQAPLPTPADQIRAWATGERLRTPGGRSGTWPGLTPIDFAGMHICPQCRIRVE